MDLGPLEKQRKDALRFELVCAFLAVAGLLTAGYLLRERIPGFLERPEVMVAALMPVFLLVGATFGFHRLRKGIERRMKAEGTRK